MPQKRYSNNPMNRPEYRHEAGFHRHYPAPSQPGQRHMPIAITGYNARFAQLVLKRHRFRHRKSCKGQKRYVPNVYESRPSRAIGGYESD